MLISIFFIFVHIHQLLLNMNFQHVRGEREIKVVLLSHLRADLLAMDLEQTSQEVELLTLTATKWCP